MSFNIVRAGHVEYLVTNLERARKFYVETLGFFETARERNQSFLRCIEERFHHSLVLKESEEPGVGHIAFRVASQDELHHIFKFLQESGLKPFWYSDEEGVGKCVRVQDPIGFPIEFYHEMKREEWLLRKFSEHKGAKIMRIDHFNLHVPDVGKAFSWYKDKLQFTCTEVTETGSEPPKLWAAWLRRKHNCHDVALTNGYGPRVHHTGFYVYDRSCIYDCADILASSGYVNSIERGPGRHGISNAFFIYLRDQDGNRIELYTGDYLTADPDWEPIRWKLSDPQRQTFWGSPAPESWFKESMRVKDYETGKFVPLLSPTLEEKPSYIEKQNLPE